MATLWHEWRRLYRPGSNFAFLRRENPFAQVEQYLFGNTPKQNWKGMIAHPRESGFLWLNERSSLFSLATSHTRFAHCQQREEKHSNIICLLSQDKMPAPQLASLHIKGNSPCLESKSVQQTAEWCCWKLSQRRGPDCSRGTPPTPLVVSLFTKEVAFMIDFIHILFTSKHFPTKRCHINWANVVCATRGILKRWIEFL